jgi:hypothetical protein
VTEAQLQQAVIDVARFYGWLHYHTHDSRRSVAGWPDLFLVHPRTGEIVVAELKATSGRVSHAQQEWIDAFAAAGVVVNVWRPSHLTGGQVARALTPSDVARAS